MVSTQEKRMAECGRKTHVQRITAVHGEPDGQDSCKGEETGKHLVKHNDVGAGSGQIGIRRVGRGKEQVPGGREKHAGAWCALGTRTVKFKGGREVGRGGWRWAVTTTKAGAREAG